MLSQLHDIADVVHGAVCYTIGMLSLFEIGDHPD